MAGVSQAVVSRVINRGQTLRIGKEARAGIEGVIRELGYSPNAVARALASSQPNAIAIVMHDITNPVYGEILQGAQKEAARLGKTVVLGDASIGQDSNPGLASLIGGGGVDGLILHYRHPDCRCCPERHSNCPLANGHGH